MPVAVLQLLDDDHRRWLAAVIGRWYHVNMVRDYLAKAKLVTIFKQVGPRFSANNQPMPLLSCMYKLRAMSFKAAAGALETLCRIPKSASDPPVAHRSRCTVLERSGPQGAIALLDWTGFGNRWQGTGCCRQPSRSPVDGGRNGALGKVARSVHTCSLWACRS